MNKYIRTKDGIYEVEWNNNVEMWCDVKTHKGFILDSMISKEDYILADTIEELCDEFVIVNRKIHQTTKAFNKIIEYFNPYDTFYGAIWCEWGLKYVAKMNDKGELALI